MKRSFAVLLSALSLLLGSCIKESYDGPEPECPTRTVLVYLAGDNNLSSEISATVEAIRRGWRYSGNRCLIYIDTYDAPPKLLSVRGGCKVTPEPYIETVAEYTEENSASAQVFGRVVREVIASYPADSYGLVFASHATGWLPEGTLSNPSRSSRTIGQDTNPGIMQGSEIELEDFAAALPDGAFNFIAFETCLMAGVEVAYELRNKTDYIVASSAEMFSFGFVPIYRSSIMSLMDTSLPLERGLIAFASSYRDYMFSQSGEHRSLTLGVIKTSGMDHLAGLTRHVFREAAQGKFVDIEGLQHFDRPGTYGDSPRSPRYFDFLDYMERAATPLRYAAIEAQVDKMVVWKASTAGFLLGQRGGFEIKRHGGMTTYVSQSHFEKLNESYSRTAWFQAIK